MKSKTELAGYISKSGSDSFAITDPSSCAIRTVAYLDVAQLKGHNLTRKGKVVLWVSVAVGVTLLLWLIKTQVDDCC